MKIFKNSMLLGIAFCGVMTISCTEDENTGPVISNQTFNLDENSTEGTVVGKVIASDSEDDNLTFSIAEGNESGAFAIDQTLGEISVASSSPLDFETNPSFTLSISVSDGDLSNFGIMTINLGDVAESEPNELTFNGATYVLEGALVENYGNYNPFDSEGDLTSHINYDFLIADDEFVLITNGDGGQHYDAVNATMFLGASVHSPNGGVFEPGIFSYKNLDGLSEGDVEGDSFFEDFVIVTHLETTGETEYEAISGTVTVTENSNLNYTLLFEVVVQEFEYSNSSEMYVAIPGTEQTFSFSYTGDFLYSDLSENRSSDKRENQKNRNL